MGEPQRIQLRRTKGWRLSEGARSCARPGPFGNPYRGPDAAALFDRELRACVADPYGASYPLEIRNIADRLHELRGLDLGCFCALDADCHVDTIIDLANRPARSSSTGGRRMSQPTQIEIPSIEAVEYGRRVVAHQIERYKGFEQRARDRGDEASAARWRLAHVSLVRDFYGHEDGGCVITAFDKRWLDPKFREAMTQAFGGG